VNGAWGMRCANRISQNSRVHAWWPKLAFTFLGLFLALLLGQQVHPISAQSESPAYWRYDAPGQLNLIVPTDINLDGVDEFIIGAGDTNVILVGADGRPQWSIPYQTSRPIRQLVSANLNGREDGSDEIVIGTHGQLTVITSEGETIWQRPLTGVPADIVNLDANQQGHDEILVAMSDGQLQLFNDQGQIIWRFAPRDSPAQEANPILRIADLDRDGRPEIIFGYFTAEGFGKILLIEPGSSSPKWERSSSGSITAVTVVEFDPSGPLEIAAATSLNRVYLYSADGHRRWPFRSPNVSVTSLVAANLNDQPALLVGTGVGTIIAYDQRGMRIWTGSYSLTPDRPIISISPESAAMTQDRLVPLAIILASQAGSSEPASVYLLNSEGRRLESSFPAADTAGLSRLIDINHDGRNELLLAGFATLELLDPGIGGREYFESWDYRLGGQPLSVLTADINLDGNDELLVGASDGRLHAITSDGELLWVVELSGPVSQIEVAAAEPGSLPEILAVHNSSTFGEDGIESFEGQVEIMRTDGRTINGIRLSSTISRILVGDINRSGRPELIVGTSDGQLIAFSLAGDEFWRTNVNASINHLLLLNGVRGVEILVGTRANTIDRYNNKGSGATRLAEFPEGLHSLHVIERDDELIAQLLVTVDDGTVRGLNARGSQSWAIDLQGTPTVLHSTGDTLLIASDEQELMHLDSQGQVLWRVPDLGRITSIYWGDLDGDVRPDVAVGNRSGQVLFLAGDGSEIWGQLNLLSELFFVTAFYEPPDQQAELLTISENGVVQLYRAEANRPPLLILPRTEVDQGKYSISVSVRDVENDRVAVFLDLFDPQTERWLSQGQRIANSGNDTLFWPVDPPADTPNVIYRFRFDDGSHQGEMTPHPGPAALLPVSWFNNLLLVGLVFVLVSAAALYAMRQARSPAAQASRFFRRLRQQPTLTLELMESEYQRTGGAPDLFLNLAGRARQEPNNVVSNLADGLYLLNARPDAALPIIITTLEKAASATEHWLHLERWQQIYTIGQALLLAPSITELSLLRPQLVQLLAQQKEDGRESDAWKGLLSILTSLRDSERVELADDRLVYLNEAIGLLKQTQHNSREWPAQIENDLVKGISQRWLGLINAEIEELKGRAQLQISLKTKHLVPSEETIVAVELKNVGRAPAEHVVIRVTEDPAYDIQAGIQVIPYLPAGRSRQVQFPITPKVGDRFRVAFAINYDDRHKAGKQNAFADMVHLLPPVRDFNPIPNPYAPGTPLRRDSAVFVGRHELFDFIRNNASRLSQQNVLILVGQRRMGKTSALLQLEHHVPDTLFPIYIDCQSFGIVPGMPALFHDLAWTISDALANRGLELPVPPLPEWQEDPTGLLQRQFLPAAKALLPEETTILLVFDEFEAFENLVRDGILPSTLFTYLRHLMQHLHGLSFVFAGTHRLEEMGTDYWSVLFNIALYRHIGFLDDEAATRLIREPVAPHIIYDDLAVDKILRVTAGHPYFLQLVCYTLVNQANIQRTGYVTISDVNAAVDEMLRLGEVHFAYLWQRSTNTERALLAAMSHLMESDTMFHPTVLVQFLGQYSIYLDPAEVTKALHNLVEREITSEIAEEGTLLYELRIGLIGLWVSQNKSLSHLYAAQNGLEAVR
jgi:outer membrane protein assembly factor BamB